MTHHLTGAVAALTLGAATVPAYAQEIDFWGWRTEDVEQYEHIIEMFEAKNPGITINMRMIEAINYGTILSTALAGESGPDSMMVRAYGSFEAVAAGGYLMPLDSEMIPDLASFPEAALKAETLRADGQLYAVPFAAQTMFVLYNERMFDELGLSAPTTWDEMEAAAKTLIDNGYYAFANGTAANWQNEVLTFGMGASTMGRGFYEDIISGDADFTDPRFVEALTRIKTMGDAYFPDGYIGLDYPSSQQLFSSELAGMFVGGSYELAAMKTMNPDIQVAVTHSPKVDAADEGLSAVFYDGGYAGNASTEHPEAVQKWLAFLATQEFGTYFANALGNVSPIPGVEFENPQLQAVAKLNETSIPYMMLVHFRYDEPSGSTLVQTEVQKMMAGDTTPEGAGQTITEGLATYYAPFQD